MLTLVEDRVFSHSVAVRPQDIGDADVEARALCHSVALRPQDIGDADTC